MRALTYHIHVPSEALKRDVECVRVIEFDNGKPVEVKTCPNGSPGIVFHLVEGRPAIQKITTRSAAVGSLPPLFLYGPGSEPSVMTFMAGKYTVIQAILKPHALKTVFNLDSSMLAQGFLAPQEFGAESLAGTMAAEEEAGGRVSALLRFMENAFKAAGHRDGLVEEALEFIERNIEAVSVKTLVDALGISERQFQKGFLSVVGGAPQTYIWVRRVNKALGLIASGEYERLSDVALALNYYDQSHFIRDIKELSWVTPKGIADRISDIHQDKAGFSYL